MLRVLSIFPSEKKWTILRFISFALFWKEVHARFNYWPSNRFGPDNWDNAGRGDQLVSSLTTSFENQCRTGKRQSPVDLVPDTECTDDHQIRNKRGKVNWNELTFRVLPHALRVTFPYFSEADEKMDVDLVTWPPASDFSNLSLREAVVYMDVKIPAEHTIDGQQYPGEIQIAHTFDNQVVYISFMIDFEKDEYNEQFEQFIREWEEVYAQREIKCQNQRNYYYYYYSYQREKYERTRPILNSTEMEDLWGKDGNRADFDLFQLLPTVYYFGYKGSYTVPPCTEGIHWRVLDLPMHISQYQFERLQSLLLDQVRDDCSHNMVPYERGVNRPIQKNRNSVWHCSADYWKPKDPEPEFWCDKWPTDYHGYHKLMDMGICNETISN